MKLGASLVALVLASCAMGPTETTYNQQTGQFTRVTTGGSVLAKREDVVSEIVRADGTIMRYAVRNEDSSISLVEWLRMRLGIRSLETLAGTEDLKTVTDGSVRKAEIGADVQKTEILSTERIKTFEPKPD